MTIYLLNSIARLRESADMCDAILRWCQFQRHPFLDFRIESALDRHAFLQINVFRLVHVLEIALVVAFLDIIQLIVLPYFPEYPVHEHTRRITLDPRESHEHFRAGFPMSEQVVDVVLHVGAHQEHGVLSELRVLENKPG